MTYISWNSNLSWLADTEFEESRISFWRNVWVMKNCCFMSDIQFIRCVTSWPTLTFSSFPSNVPNTPLFIPSVKLNLPLSLTPQSATPHILTCSYTFINCPVPLTRSGTSISFRAPFLVLDGGVVRFNLRPLYHLAHRTDRILVIGQLNAQILVL